MQKGPLDRLLAMKYRQNLLIVRLRSIGDMILTTPVLERIHHNYPDIMIHYIAEKGMGEVLSTNEHIDNLVLVDKSIGSQLKLIWWLVRTPFYMAINLHGGPRSVLMTMLSLAPKRIGSKTGSPLCRFYTTIVRKPAEITGVQRKYHSVERTVSVFEQAGFMIGDTSTLRQHLPVPYELCAKMRVLLQHSGIVDRFMVMHGVVRGKNEWGLDKKRDLCERVFKRYGIKTVLLGAASDEEYLLNVQDGREYMLVLAGQVSLLESAAIMKLSACFVGLDSGPAHMAAAIGLPVAVFFGSTQSYLWRPWGDNVKVFEHKNSDGTPVDPDDSTGGLSAISVEDVFDWVSTQLEHSTGVSE